MVKHIVLADSKAGYLKSQITFELDQVSVTWWFRPGARIHEQLRFAEWKLPKEFEKADSIVLYCWLGTYKSVKYIYLHFPEVKEGVSFVPERLKSVLELRERFPALRVVLLEIPPISIVEWNQHKGHSNVEEFQESCYVMVMNVLHLSAVLVCILYIYTVEIIACICFMLYI